jgi:hypothetical protein
LRYFCSPQHTNGALHPIIGQMERATGLTHDDTPQSRLDKFDALLGQTSTCQLFQAANGFGCHARKCRRRPDCGYHHSLLSMNAGRSRELRRQLDVLEVLIGQMAECREINTVLSKPLGGHPEPCEPVRNLVHRAAPPILPLPD